MRVHVIGPNLLGQNEQFHVHAEGCADVRRSPVYASREFAHDKAHPISAADQRAVVEYVYADQIEESGGLTWEDYGHDFKWFPCASALPVDTEPDDADPLAAPSLTGESLAAIAGGYRGRLHGDDAHGRWDVEFPVVASAAAFAAMVSADGWGWHAELRDPVTTLSAPVTLTVWQ